MRKILFASAFVVGSALTMGATPGQAASGPWCAANASAQALECNFATEAQCEAHVSGIGGTCETNPGFGTVRAQAREAQARQIIRPVRPASRAVVPDYPLSDHRP